MEKVIGLGNAKLAVTVVSAAGKRIAGLQMHKYAAFWSRWARVETNI